MSTSRQNNIPQNNIPQNNISQNNIPQIGERSSRSSDVIHRLTFSSETVKRLTAEDFDLTSKEMITLKYDDCILVLFYVENTESYQLADIWALAAQQVAGPVFAAINMLNERKVAEAFTRLKSDGSNPIHWAALRQYPFILVYRNRWPVAVYNGDREVQAIIDYSLTRACQAGYYEIEQLGGGSQAENNLEIGPYQPYQNEPGQPARVRDVSVQYVAGRPIRGFNPKLSEVAPGTPAAAAEATTLTAEEQRAQAEEDQGTPASLTETQDINNLINPGATPQTAPM